MISFYYHDCSIRKIADMLSADGYYTIIPKILNPCMDGSEGGDGEGDNCVVNNCV